MKKVYIVSDGSIIAVYDNREKASKHCAEYNQYFDCNWCRIIEKEVL